MTELKEKGHDLNVTNIVVHKINKTAGNKQTALKLRSKDLKIDTQEIHFVADIRKSFQKRSKPTHGIFDTSDTLNNFHVQLKAYVTDEIDFITFTKKSMKSYENEIKKSAPASGAFVVFANYIYTVTKDRYLLIFSINNNQGYNLDEKQLTIKEILNLDLSKLDVAALVNISKWQKYEAGDVEDIRTYLAFIKGKKDLSSYFLDFIGCADKTTSTESSRQLLSALNQYLEDEGYSKEDIKSKKKAVFDYCQTCVKDKTEVLLDQISYKVNPDNPDSFALFASAEKYGVGEIVKPDTNVLRSLQYIEYKSTDLSISFSKSKLNKDEITYNADNKSLTIRALPEDLIKQLEQNG